ncbi:uncharacterized protein VICG_01844 [Vittaforma corneae ATCC 50505]|uniref:Uncharacterized protein n=1 Tax=Vittaforma corneae (strain ATCC 50505) TaxID=993615 RepID=L2GKZ0_VITCO|nr:uncharacterized protein VICG_01844 [Vittaforma corneae ATCC 50505]ELA41145.1 hypothetical protein VICG_01844 [Vittaforma corneae ATCC 50505]
MKKRGNIKANLSPNRFPIVEFITHIAFYGTRLILYTTARGTSFKTLNHVVASASAIIIGYVFSLFLLAFVLYNLLKENTYGYCLAAVMMLHNFLLSITILMLMRVDIRIKRRYWIAGLMISTSYILEMFITIFFIYKKRKESNKAVFRNIGADPAINDMFSIRQRLQTFGSIDLFIAIVIAKNLYLPPQIFSFKFEHITIAILALTVLQHVFVYAKFHDEDITQRKMAIVITIVKAVVAALLIVLIAANYTSSEYLTRVIKIMLCTDLLVLTLVFLYYLWKDMKNFGKGLKKHILFRTRELTL